MTTFYPSVRKHISPSALAQWHNQRSQFIRSYFAGEKTPETAAMQAGKKFHKLIEGGFIDVEHRYEFKEAELRVQLKNGVEVFGIPDSHEVHNGANGLPVHFVDYKSSKNDGWTDGKLAQDLKMLCTAWLVWQECNEEPLIVKGIIEWIGTEWDGTELVLNGESESYEYDYTAQELRDFGDVIEATINEINEAYTYWLKGTDALVNDDDCALYADIDRQITELEARQKEIKDRIKEQMTFGGVTTYESGGIGTFYFIERKSYEYPDDLIFATKKHAFTLKEYEEASAACSAAKKKYELANKPSNVSKGLGFRAKK